MPEQIRVEITPNQRVTAIGYPAAKRDHAGVTLILGHGAGAGQTSGFMTRFATELAARGINAVTSTFYTPSTADTFRTRTITSKLVFGQ